ncbi:MAG: hypothetical protein Q7K55_01380 [Candidatus Levybacteria bacterium]|nr:hypothetical protein [Candidatus Levybacteria bacterium]
MYFKKNTKHKKDMIEKGVIIMKLALGNIEIQFKKVELEFFDVSTEVFAQKNNKTLRETLNSKKYKKLEKICITKYSEYLDTGLGQFLHILKNNRDNYFKDFLNQSGDLQYIEFKIKDLNIHNLKGLYLFKVNDEIVYIGRCKDSFKKRINIGYGRISPKNCYLDGQSTNCFINNLICTNYSEIDFYISSQNENSTIESYEKLLIKSYKPKWNRYKMEKN